MHLTLEVGSTTNYILIYPFWTPGRTRIHAVWPSFFPSRLRILSLYLDGRGMGTSACQPQVFLLKKRQLNGFDIIITFNVLDWKDPIHSFSGLSLFQLRQFFHQRKTVQPLSA